MAREANDLDLSGPPPALAGSWERLKSGLLDLLFPPRCVVCRQPGSWLCSVCLSSLERLPPVLCMTHGSQQSSAAQPCPKCAREGLPLQASRSIAYSQGALRKAIHAFKYSGRHVLAAPLSDLMSHWLLANPLPIDVLVPVALHRARERARGYNQSALLAEGVSKALGVEYWARAVSRIRDTRPQVGLNAEERRQNVLDAFCCQDAGVAGRRVLLIDDVMTTGATLFACASALRQAGAAEVWALTLAHAR